MLITYILQVTLCLAIFYTFYHFVLQEETLFQTNRIYLLVTMLMSLFLPLIRIYIQNQQHASSIITAPYVYVGSYLNAIGESITVTPQDRGIPWLYIFELIYLTGVLVTSIRFISEIGSILAIKRVGKKTLISGQVCIHSTDVKSPFSFFNAIYLPVEHHFNENELEEIIAHEKSHIQSKHTLDIMFMEIVCIGLWLSPMVYLYRKKLRDVHEFLADDEVLKNTPWEKYASFLVAQKGVGLQNHLSNQMFYSQLKNRLLMMNKQRSFHYARIKYLGLIPLFAFALVLFSFREKSIPNINQTKPGDGVLNIYKDGLKIYTSINSIWSNEPLTSNSDSSILVITEDKRYFLNHKEIKYEFLEHAMTEAVNNNLERTLYIYLPKGSTVGDFNKFFDLEIKLNAQFIYIVPELNPGRVNYRVKDTMPTTVITAFNLNENPVKEDKSYKNYVDFKTKDRAAQRDSNSSYWYAGTEVYNPSGILPDHVFVDEMPRFPGSSDDMFNFIYKSIKYPQEDREKGNEGLVIVQFIVEPDGSISNAKVVKGISSGLNNEALRVINSMNDMPEKWIPGIYEGKAVPIVFTLPFKFVLQKKEINQDGDRLENGVYTYVEEMPSFPDGAEAMYKYIYQNIKFPEKARENKISGQVIVQFVVSTSGDIQNAKVIRGVGGGCDEEALRVVNGMPRWEPGKHHGMYVPVVFTLPIKFVLQPDQDKPKSSPQSISTNQDKYFNSKMEWIHTDTSLIYNPDTKEEEIVIVSTNPSLVSNKLEIEFSKNVKSAIIFNDIGNVMWQKDFRKDDTIQWIDVSQWVPGIYRVKSSSEKQSVFSSFIVQH